MGVRSAVVRIIALLAVPSLALRPASASRSQQCAVFDWTLTSYPICYLQPGEEEEHGASAASSDSVAYLETSYSNNDLSCTGQLDYINDKLCVYAYPSFQNGRGVAIFTTPPIAEEFTQRTADLPINESSSPVNTFHESLKVITLPSRGVGVIATSTIAAGTLLSHVSPILVVHNAETPHAFERESHLLDAISHLPPQTQQLFNTLAKTYHDPRVHAQDIIKTNSFALDIGGVPHLTVFPEPSRFNHDCAPNAIYFVDSLRLTNTVHATRQIEEGEEVTISYIDPLSEASWRREELQQAFGFRCTCERCSADDADDQDLREIRALEAELGDWETIAEGIQWWDYTEKAERLVDLYGRLGLEGFMNTAYGHAALTYNAVGESGKATMYARKALDTARWRHGSHTGSRAVKVWEEFLEGGAWKHWSWRRRMADADSDSE